MRLTLVKPVGLSLPGGAPTTTEIEIPDAVIQGARAVYDWLQEQPKGTVLCGVTLDEE